MSRSISRRKLLLAGGGGVAFLAGSASLASALYNDKVHGQAPKGLTDSTPLADANPVHATADPKGAKRLAFAGTDGWASMPAAARALGPWWPDPWAADGRDTYIFGFRDVTGLAQDEISGQKNKVQISAPLIEVSVGEELWVTLANLGLAMRPDLVDSHTLHWHGFRNAIPFYDGVPETSISVPIGRQFTYVFRPQDAGTYMYHCHFEDVEHVTMGMTGIVFVRPPVDTQDPWYSSSRRIVRRAYADRVDGGNATNDPTKPLVDDGHSSGFDREFAILLTEIDSRAHFNDAHILATDWTDFRANFWLMNGRAYPDTLEPNAPFDAADRDTNENYGKPARADDNTLQPPTREDGSTLDRLASQPYSSRIVCEENDRVLLRLVNLGFEEQVLTLPGIPMRVVGMDARPMSPSRQTITDSITLGPGQSVDAIFTAPATTGGIDKYPLYNRDVNKYRGRADGNDLWWGGQRTEVTVLSKGTLAEQQFTNDWDPAALKATTTNYPGLV